MAVTEPELLPERKEERGGIVVETKACEEEKRIQRREVTEHIYVILLQSRIFDGDGKCVLGA